MDSMIMWGGYAAAVLVAGIATVMMQKKDRGNGQEVDREQELLEKVTLLENDLREVKDSLAAKVQELKTTQQTLNEKASALEALENDFESKMDDIVESSIQKISHAEEAKEEAIEAAEANYEAAAEAHATIKEKESIIADLQKQLEA